MYSYCDFQKTENDPPQTITTNKKTKGSKQEERKEEATIESELLLADDEDHAIVPIADIEKIKPASSSDLSSRHNFAVDDHGYVSDDVSSAPTLLQSLCC